MQLLNLFTQNILYSPAKPYYKHEAKCSAVLRTSYLVLCIFRTSYFVLCIFRTSYLPLVELIHRLNPVIDVELGVDILQVFGHRVGA